MENGEISFVTWPDGKVDSASLTVAGERHAWQRMVAQWLPAEWFGDVSANYSVIESLRRGMQDKGFRCHTIKIGKDGQPSDQAPWQHVIDEEIGAWRERAEVAEAALQQAGVQHNNGRT